jgi:hypothetical protein
MYVALGVKPDSEEEGRTKVKSQELNKDRPMLVFFLVLTKPLPSYD